MSGYRIKQTVLIALGFISAIVVANNHKALFPDAWLRDPQFVDYAFICGIGIGLGVLIAYLTGGSDDKPTGGSGGTGSQR